MKLLLAIAAAGVVMTATAADARHHAYRHHARTCVKMRHGHCVRWSNHGYAMSTARHARYKVGYRFGPSYAYTNLSALPPTYVRRYDLNPDYRYVYRDNYIYVVDPTTYAVTRVINALTGR
jgi:hypothetical protein